MNLIAASILSSQQHTYPKKEHEMNIQLIKNPAVSAGIKLAALAFVMQTLLTTSPTIV